LPPAAMADAPAARRFIPALDGIRGVAVLGVLVFHASDWARNHHYTGGFLGVDVFFVLSGCLITELLVAEHLRSGRIRLRAFYTRRVLRLWPAMVICLALAGLVAAVVGRNSSDGVAYPLAAAASWFDVANIVQSIRPGAMGLLNHTWSLSQEEQFYLLWPFVLRAALPRLSLRRLAALLVVGAVACAIYRALWFVLTDYQSDIPGIYFQPLARMDGMLLGCALGLRLADPEAGRSGRSRWWPSALIGLATAAFSLVVELTSPLLYLGGFSAVAVAAAIVIRHAHLATTGPVVAALCLPPLRYIGRISYGLYLFSFPIGNLVAYVDGYQHGNVIVVVQIVLSIAFAALSFELVERRFLRLKGVIAPRAPA
ncbi:MAG TPA: acyltransferase, partial [Aeromicrobium sp.]|nr:acyltransferase [Aeromicrobium sp.]